jgi:type II secretory pathway pseudopilin PulG
MGQQDADGAGFFLPSKFIVPGNQQMHRSFKLNGLAVGTAAVVAVAAVLAGTRIAHTRTECARARLLMAEVQEALRRYYLDHRSYPTTQQGLSALSTYYLGGEPDLDPGILFPRPGPARPPRDEWGRTYIYRSDGQRYVLKSPCPRSLWNSSCNDAPMIVRSPSKPPS